MGHGLNVVRVSYGDDRYKEGLLVRKTVLGDPFGLEFDERFYGDDENAVLLACALFGGCAIGTAMLVKVDDETVKMRQVAVLNEWQGLGMGARLMRYLEGFAEAQGYRTIRVPAQRTAESFYQRLGYISNPDETYDEVGIPHIMMYKTL